MGKLRVPHRGASMACCTFIPKSTTLSSVWIVRNALIVTAGGCR